MANRSVSRFTIAQIMFVIVAVAVILALVMASRADSTFLGVPLVIGLIVWWNVLVVRRVFEVVNGVECPACAGRKLQRRSVHSFGERFFVCPDCGVRCRRSLVNVFDGWRDASGPEFDAMYQKPGVEDPWNAPPGLEDEEETVTSKTHVNLVRNKRLRTPRNPNGPGLE